MTTDFDRWAYSYDTSSLQPAYQVAHHAVLDRTHQLVSPQRVLDVGCGTGRLLRAATERFPGCVLVGIDSSTAMLEAARTEIDAGGFISVQAAAEHLPFADDSFDVVVSTASFRHWTDPDAGMQEICRVLAPGGLLCMAYLGGWQRAGRLATLARGRRLPPALARALSASGLHVLGAEYISGFGPITTITVVLAQTPANRGRWTRWTRGGRQTQRA